MVCFGYITVNTVHIGGNKDDDDYIIIIIIIIIAAAATTATATIIEFSHFYLVTKFRLTPA